MKKIKLIIISIISLIGFSSFSLPEINTNKGIVYQSGYINGPFEIDDENGYINFAYKYLTMSFNNNEVYDYNDINHKENNFNEEEVVINSVQQYNSNNNVNNVNNINDNDNDDNNNRIQNEFDELDKEIFTLKKQLKMMITSK